MGTGTAILPLLLVGLLGPPLTVSEAAQRPQEGTNRQERGMWENLYKSSRRQEQRERETARAFTVTDFGGFWSQMGGQQQAGNLQNSRPVTTGTLQNSRPVATGTLQNKVSGSPRAAFSENKRSGSSYQESDSQVNSDKFSDKHMAASRPAENSRKNGAKSSKTSQKPPATGKETTAAFLERLKGEKKEQEGVRGKFFTYRCFNLNISLHLYRMLSKNVIPLPPSLPHTKKCFSFICIFLVMLRARVFTEVTFLPIH
jgi:hypothetical protein